MSFSRNIIPTVLLVAGAAALVIAVTACDREQPRGALATTQPAEPVLDLDMKPLTPLLPNRPTHTTVDHLGNIYWVQETDRRDDTMFVIGEGGIPRATQLSVANLATLLGAESAKGNIHGIAASFGSGGDIYFYFQGESGRRTLGCIGTFSPKTERLRILADTDALATATGMGRSLPLARASVVSDGRVVWIWTRHTDNWAMFRIEPSRIATSGPVRLARAFDAVTLEGKPVGMNREDVEIAPAPSGGLFFLDVAKAQLLSIAPDGKSSLVRTLVGLPSVLSSPSVDKDQNLVLFAANAALIGVKKDDPNAPRTDTTYPALLIFKPDKVVSINRDHMQAYPGFPVFATRLRQLVPHAREQGWITYDAGSGELLRVKVTENLWP